MLKNINYYWAAIIILVLVSVAAVHECKSNSKIAELNAANVHAALDTVTHYRNKYGQQVAHNTLLQSQHAADVLKLHTADEMIVLLQQQLKLHKKTSSAVAFATETRIDSVFVRDTVIIDNTLYTLSFKDEWIALFVGRDSMFSLTTTDKYSVATIPAGHNTYDIEITSLSPYSTVKQIRGWRQTTPQPKRFTLALQAGFGAQYGLFGLGWDIGPYIGLNVGYNILRW